MFKDDIGSDPEIIDLGQVAVFYVPVNKLRATCPTQTDLDRLLIERYNGFTKSTVPFEGHYKDGSGLLVEDHIRYEVSFEGHDQVAAFLEAIKQLCRDLSEESIYLTMGEHSYLVQPRKP